jgi:hypothetical protein
MKSLLDETYWENFELDEQDVEFLYNFLLEQETPMNSQELAQALVIERLRREREAAQAQRAAAGDLYLPQESYAVGQALVFPALKWRRGTVTSTRSGKNPELGDFQVIQVKFENGEEKEFAGELSQHALNEAMQVQEEDQLPDVEQVLEDYSEDLIAALEEQLETNPGFVRIAGRWFPRALLVDINVGHLNLAEAVLDMAGGGPLPTRDLLQQIGLPLDINPNLVEFSLDMAMEEDSRFDEVGPAGDVLWFLNRLEPEGVREPPLYLRYQPIEYDRALLTPEMLELERNLDDELSPLHREAEGQEEGVVALIFPHWRSGTLPLSTRIRDFFPTAYESPRIRFSFVDADTGQRFPGWVVREKRYVYGLSDWYQERGLMPGSLIFVSRGQEPGEVVIRTDVRRSNREWIRTVLVGSDGGVVYAMLKQVVNAAFDERMAIAVPDVKGLDQIWQSRDRRPFERVVMHTVRELAKLNPQSHVHASELYAAINVVRRCPPGPILALLASKAGYIHVGDLHFRLEEIE